MSIKTFVRQKDDLIIREAILREILRGGQVYYLHNDVASIENTAEKLTSLVPEARVVIGHGQMRERELERVMSDFYHQRYNVLVCSTIIETGIDVPTANTIIIERADNFGLAQLHQLRGRVGRGGGDAFCYLVMSSNAKPPQRLQEISKIDDGFVLAEKDLELRGAGEIYGKAQSGEINLEFANIGDTQIISQAQSAVDFLFENQEEWKKYLSNRPKTLEKYQRLTLLN